MNKLKKKQKIAIIIFAISIVAGIAYYAYAKDTNYISISKDELEINTNENNNVNEKTKSSEEDEEIVVHILGAVNNQGIIKLKLKSRLADAIEKAGGLKENACIDAINLASILEDGMQIKIPTIEESKNEQNQTNENSNTQNITTSSKENSNTQNVTASNKENTKVNLNTATQTQLETLPGIGPSTALKIISYRTEKGKFKSIEEIKEVSGIGESKYNKIKEFILVK